ncbi:IS3 family transposase [Bifidobacterium pseudolongum]
MTTYIDYWNNRQHQKRLQGHTPVEYRNMTLKG